MPLLSVLGNSLASLFWLDTETYVRKIQPLLLGVKVPVLSAALGMAIKR